MTADENACNFFEISVNDIQRAKKFYEAIFNIKMELVTIQGIEMAMFPYKDGNGKVPGALVKSPDHKPSADGAKIYLNGNPNLDVPLNKIPAAGGTIIMPKTQIDENVGYMGFFVDTEGNVMALHSNK